MKSPCNDATGEAISEAVKDNINDVSDIIR